MRPFSLLAFALCVSLPSFSIRAELGDHKRVNSDVSLVYYHTWLHDADGREIARLVKFPSDGTAEIPTSAGRTGIIQLAWTFEERTRYGDIYQVTRTLPWDKSKNETKYVLYTGKKLILWNDLSVTITLEKAALTQP